MKKTGLTLYLGVIALLCSLGAGAGVYQQYSSVQIINSEIDSTPVGLNTPSSGYFSNLVTRGTFSIPLGNASQMGWNQVTGNGETDFFNQHGSGSGGFNWYAVGGTTYSGSPGSPIMQLSSGGTLTASSFHGAVVLASLPAQCPPNQIMNGISQTGDAVCISSGNAAGMIITSGICTTPNASYGVCNMGPFSWPSAFADSNYAVTCTLVNPSSTGSAVSATVAVTSQYAGYINLSLTNGTSNAAAPTTAAAIDCTAVHL
jgi:hypothetical protein